jgi:hypothetical protein
VNNRPPLVFADYCALVAWALTVAFLVLYAVRSRWHDNIVSRALMLQTLSHVLLLSLVAVALIFGRDYAGRELIRSISYAGLVFAQAYMDYVLLHVQRNGDAGQAFTEALDRKRR